jgi:hypothetical protein
MWTNWIIGPPTPEQVVEQARKYPAVELHGGAWGYWQDGNSGGIRILARINDGRIEASPCFLKQGRYLPLSAEGLPVDYAQLREVAEAAKDIVLGNSSLDRNATGCVCPIVWQAEWDAIRAALKELEEAC